MPLIRTMPDPSTAHLDAASKQWLANSANDSSVMQGAYGWWTPVYDQPAPEPDNLCHPDVLEAIFAFAREQGADCILFGLTMIDETGKRLRDLEGVPTGCVRLGEPMEDLEP
jgi:hypothetical protein